MPQAAAPAPARPDALLAWMGNLADPTRLRLLRVLEREELSVLELCEVLKLPQSTVSRHLKVLADQDWLANRREGTASYYRLSDGLDAAAKRLWRFARAETESWSTVQQDALRLEGLLRDRRSEAQSFFTGEAAEWHRVRGEAYGSEFESVILRSLVHPDWTIADLGCGTGAFTVELAKSGARVIAVDQSASMLRLARRHTREYGNVELHQADLESVPIPSGSCDVALLVLVLSYVGEIQPVLREAHRILAPGGRLFAVDAYPHDDESFRRRLRQARPGVDPARIAEQLVELGLERVGAGGPITSRSNRSGPDLFLAQGTRPGRRRP
ncbi:MAG TPA: metalloregulator ArsR/SmtB family transcription factor [Anaeromyxobacter sp.]|nr:metalloregulator ArsR/SmtB family transcription factor [Anaeromyxobacter sp.]